MKTFEEINTALTEATETGAIYNVDFNDAKSRASRILENDIDAWKKEYVYADHDNDQLRELGWTLVGVVSIATFPSKKLVKAIDAYPASDAKTALTELMNKHIVTAELVKQCKPLIIKGRKPSVNVTPQRTLENTGTCACCKRNVKMLRGQQIGYHGYHKMRGFKASADCFGTAHDALEVSPGGLDAVIRVVTAQLKRARHCERNTLSLRATLKQFKIERKNWKASELPS